MSENNLDKIFKEKLTNYQELPDEKVWEAIANSLDKKKQSRRLIPIWWKVGGVAAIITILFFAINPFSTNKPVTPIISDIKNNSRNANDTTKEKTTPEATSITTITNKSDKENLNNSNKKAVLKKETNILNNQKKPLVSEVATNKQHRNSSSSKTTLGSNLTPEKNSQNNPIAPHNTSSDSIKLAYQNVEPLNKNEEPTLELSSEAKSINKKSIFEAVEDKNLVNTNNTPHRKWSAGPSVAPVYFNSIGQGSPINPILASNSKTGNVTLSYGIIVAYEVSKKLSVRSGVHKVNYGYDTHEISFTSSFNASTTKQLSNIDYSNKSQSIILKNANTSLSGYPNSEGTAPKKGSEFATDITGKNPSREGSMGQYLGYLEVPLELNYALINRKFGVALIGGVSSLFLTDNSVILESNGLTTELGEANNINSVNISTNFGLGLNYKFTPKFKFNVEPVFKYQWNTFSNTSGNFNPYSLGVYSGFSIKF